MAYSQLKKQLEAEIAKALYDERLEALSKAELADVSRFMEQHILKIVVPYIERNFERKKDSGNDQG